MLTRGEGEQLKLHQVTIEDLVPSDHFLRKLNATVDFTFIYGEVEHLYSAHKGRPSIDPVVLVKYLLLGYLYGIESERRIEEEIQVNMAYRWFLGLDLDDRVPDHSTISQNRRRRFNGQNLYRRLFERILQQCMDQGLVGGKVIMTDSTHVKAHSSRRSESKVLVEQEALWYIERLDAYEAAERKELEAAGKIQPKNPKQKKETAKKQEKTVSGTDPEAGFMHRPGKPLGMHYLSHQSLDSENGIIVDVAVTPGNVTDGAPYLDRVDYICDHVGIKPEQMVGDSAYDISLIHQALKEKSIRLVTPENGEQPRYKAEIERAEFQYDEEADCFHCPKGKVLRLRCLSRTDSNIYREYRTRPKDCRDCPLREKCLAPSQASRKIVVNIFEQAVEDNHSVDGTSEHRMALALRQIWCEGTFAAQKARHKLRYLLRTGLEAAEDHCLLSATAMNLKRMIKCLG